MTRVRLGILKAGQSRPNALARRGDSDRQFRELLGEDRFEFHTYEVRHNQFPARIDEADAYLVTGSPSSVFDGDPWIGRLLEFIVELDRAQCPTAGICFGHQAVAQALGGKVIRNPAGWEIGCCEVNLTPVGKAHPILGGWPDPVRLYQSHRDVVSDPPPRAENLAVSTKSRFQGFAIGSHILTLQGHPEFDVDQVREIIEIHGHDLALSEREQAVESLSKPDGKAAVGGALVSFLGGR